ncbi:hypothetical protein Q7A53_05570 [Halobacillus rhizosphaerae]|uniref:hypothetical protein n=1 Tax=Halobacillus rhizosphaerae TaxID=3064889 RepID=UPI00398B7FDD
MTEVSITITCECGNSNTYTVKNIYHSSVHETYINLTDAIYDEKFQARTVTDGMLVNCIDCGTEFEVV